MLAYMGRGIKAVREARRLTQEDASHHSGIGYKRWQVIEAGKANITIGTLGRMAQALRVRPSKLLK